MKFSDIGGSSMHIEFASSRRRGLAYLGFSAAALAALTACGGSNDSSNPAPNATKVTVATLSSKPEYVTGGDTSP